MPLSLRRFLMLLACLATAGAAAAQKDYEPDSQMVRGHKWAVVKRLGTNLFGIPVAAGGLSADQRARTIADRRLDPLLGQGVLTIPENIEVGRMNGEVVIIVKNPQRAAGLPDPTLILTIDSAFERFMGRGRLDIAYYWRDLMRKWSRVRRHQGPGSERRPRRQAIRRQGILASGARRLREALHGDRTHAGKQRGRRMGCAGE